MHEYFNYYYFYCMFKNLEQVMQNPVAQKMILEEEIDGEPTMRLKSVAFRIKNQ